MTDFPNQNIQMMNEENEAKHYFQIGKSVRF